VVLGKPNMIIHLTGSDTYRSAKRLAELRAAFIVKHDPRGLNVVGVDGETATSAEMRTAVTATGMFASKRFVSLDRYQPDGSLLLDGLVGILGLVAEKNNEVIVVVRDLIDDAARPVKRSRATAKKPSKKTAGGSFVLPDERREVFSRLTPAQTVTWISTEAKSRGGSFEPAAAQRLVALCNGDSWRIATELDKLVSFAGAKSVTVAEVETMVMSENSSDIFALTDALGQRQSARALELLHRELSAGTNEFSLIATLAGHIRTLYHVQQAQQRGSAPSALASELGLHPFVVQKALAQTSRFTTDELRDLHHRLVTIDHDLKTSPLDAETLLDVMLIQPRRA